MANLKHYERSCKRKEKALYFSIFNCIFFPLFEQEAPYFLFGLSHASYVAIFGEQWEEIEWDRGWAGRGQSWTTGQQDAHIGLNGLSLWHQNPILKHFQYVPSHSELKTKIFTILYLTNTSLPTSLSSSPTTHRPFQLQQSYPTYILPPQGLCTYHHFS